MTTLREAAQQALEQLEHAWIECDYQGNPMNECDKDVVKAANALRTALAEQCQCGEKPKTECPGEWEPGCGLGANAKYAKRVEPEQEPVQEPVLTMNKMGSLVECSPTIAAFDLPDGEFNLYAHPPQRKPLTDEQIVDLIPSTGFRGPIDALWFARAIERAHGIGGEA